MAQVTKKLLSEGGCCARCAADPRPFDRMGPGIGGSPRNCAFASDSPDAVFSSDNWNCATANALRTEKAEEQAIWTEDQWAFLLPADGHFLVLSWYKHHGALEGAWVLSSDEMRPATRGDFEEMIRLHLRHLLPAPLPAQPEAHKAKEPR